MRGRKTSKEDIYKIMVSYAASNNYNEISRELNISEATIRDIVIKNKDKPEFKKLQDKKKEEFIDSANKIIDKATILLDRRLTTAIKNQEEIDELLEEIYNARDEEDKELLSPKQKVEIAKKMSKIQITSLNEITTALGTVYDKRALAKGDSTSNTNIILGDSDKELLNNVSKRSTENN